MLQGVSIDILSREYQERHSELISWRDAFISAGTHTFKRNPEESKLKESQRVIGRQAMEIELIKKKISYLSNS